MSGPFPTWLGNQRHIGIVTVPTVHQQTSATVVAVTPLGSAISLSTTNLNNLSVHAYIYYAQGNPDVTAAVSNQRFALQFQFQDNTHAAVGAATTALIASIGSGAGTALDFYDFSPNWPLHFRLVPPANAVEIVLVINILAVNGAPTGRYFAGWGIDISNNSTPGDIGGGGLVAQGANNPNTF